MERQLSRQERVAERWHWLLAVMLAGVAMAAWCVLVSPVEVTGHTPVPEAVRVSYRPVLLQGEQLGDNLQAVWSPVLFSLPTHVGFSREMLSSSRVMLPPVQLPEDPFLMTSAPPVLLHSLKNRNMMSTKRQVKKTISRRRKQKNGPGDTSVFAVGREESRDNPVYIRFGQELAREMFLTNPVSIATDSVQDGVFRITLAPEGYVESVFVDKSSGDARWDADVVRDLYTWRTEPGVEKVEGYVFISVGQHDPVTGKGESAP